VKQSPCPSVGGNVRRACHRIYGTALGGETGSDLCRCVRTGFACAESTQLNSQGQATALSRAASGCERGAMSGWDSSEQGPIEPQASAASECRGRDPLEQTRFVHEPRPDVSHYQ